MILILFSKPVYFYGNCYEKEKGPESSPFPGYQICLEVFSLVIYHLTIFDALIQIRF